MRKKKGERRSMNDKNEEHEEEQRARTKGAPATMIRQIGIRTRRCQKDGNGGKNATTREDRKSGATSRVFLVYFDAVGKGKRENVCGEEGGGEEER